MNKDTGRGKNPPEKAIRMLWAEAGGRCQFEGCNEVLTEDNQTCYKLINGNNAHIVASSSNGPRGNDQSHLLSDDIENIILLCPKHHKLVDENTAIYTTEKLKSMKEMQLKEVKFLLDSMNYQKTKILILESPIKGTKEVCINYNQAVDAVRKAGMNPSDANGLSIYIKGYGGYKNSEYWEQAEQDLIYNINQYIAPLYKRFPETILSVFPIAPIPLIIKLGFILGDKRQVHIFQKTRTPDTWEWLQKQATNSFETKKIKCNSESSKTALVVSLTAEINIERVLRVYDAGIVYCIKAKRKGVDCISSEEDLKLFWQEYQKVCDLLKNEEQCETVVVFPAVPVSAAFEMGRRYMPGIYPKMVIYDDDDGFVKTLTLGGESNVK